MKAIKFAVAMLAILFGLSFNVVTVAAGYVTGSSVTDPPTVPLEIFSKGRQEVTRYLLLPVDHVKLRPVGGSVVATQGRDEVWLFRNDLERNGYRFDGSFDTLSKIIAAHSVSGYLVPLKDGSFDFRIEVTFFDASSTTLLSGSGWVPVRFEKGGDIMVSECQPWVSIPESVNVAVPFRAGAAKWISGEWNGDPAIDFWGNVGEDGVSVFRDVPMSIIGHGYLAVQPWEGSVIVTDLSNGYRVLTDRVLVIMGKTRSPDVVSMTDAEWDPQFQRIGDRIYGRYPLRELPISYGFGEPIDLSVPVWGTKVRLQPQTVKVIGLADGAEMLLEPNQNGKWPLNLLPAGQGYHILVDFGDQLVDYPAGGKG